jgi:hypothetical protein
MPTKDEYTQAFIQHNPIRDWKDYEEAYQTVWHNIRQNGGLRLTQQGCIFLVDVVQLEYFEIDLKEISVSNRFLIDLDRFIKCPYYLQSGRTSMMNGRFKKILLFDKKVYFALTMYNNDFEKFLNAHKI